jgi:hypothetical protein
MGDAFTNVGGPSSAVNLQGTNPFADVTLVKDGTAVYSTSGGSAISYYNVRGTQTDGQIV